MIDQQSVALPSEICKKTAQLEMLETKLHFYVWQFGAVLNHTTESFVKPMTHINQTMSKLRTMLGKVQRRTVVNRVSFAALHKFCHKTPLPEEPSDDSIV